MVKDKENFANVGVCINDASLFVLMPSFRHCMRMAWVCCWSCDFYHSSPGPLWGGLQVLPFLHWMHFKAFPESCRLSWAVIHYSQQYYMPSEKARVEDGYSTMSWPEARLCSVQNTGSSSICLSGFCWLDLFRMCLRTGLAQCVQMCGVFLLFWLYDGKFQRGWGNSAEC